MSPPIVVCVFIVSHSSASSGPGLVRISSGMPTLPTSCSALAWRSSSASAPRHADLERERSQKRPMRSMWHAGLGVAPLDGDAEPLEDLDLGLRSSSVRSRTSLLEQLVVAASPRGAAALGQLAPGDRAHACRRQRRRSGATTSRSRRRRTRAGRRRRNPRRPAAPPGRRDAGKRRPPAARPGEQRDQEEPIRGRRCAAGRRASLSRSRWPAPRRRPSARRRRPAWRARPAASAPTPTTTTRSRKVPGAKRPRTTSENETVRMRAGRAAVVDPGAAVVEAAGGELGAQARRGARRPSCRARRRRAGSG